MLHFIVVAVAARLRGPQKVGYAMAMCL